jgi:acyl-CoA synthetase (NDP forming)
VVVGFCGTLVELVKDVAVAAAPISPSGAERLLRGLRLWPLLAGFRGSAPMDVRAAAQAISRISALAAAAGSALTELDVNPLIVFRDGEGVAAVDCRAAVQD